ncbi:MAG: glycerol-3-phosphate transporter substrate-binding protein [Deinococcus sp.]|nr:glycerol-3-phosphate transporter substrate-binding protein [Deinococcus sp.]
MLRFALPLSVLLAASAHAAPVRVEFWHAMDGVQAKVSDYAREFNRSQTEYEVVPTSLGNYRELLPRLQSALKTGKAPALVQLEYTQFSRMAADGQLADLTKPVDALPGALTRDFAPAVWKAGEAGGRRLGLPWNVSVPVLMYNAGALNRVKMTAPDTWTQLESASRKLAGGSKRPLVVAADAWTFEADVLARGGSLSIGTQPALNSPDAVEALTQLARMSAAGLAQPRTLNEATRAAFDFARGQNTFVLASVANWVDAKKLPFFNLGIAPFPCEKVGNCTVPLGGANLAVPRGTPANQQAGALAFWAYLMEAPRLADWVKTTAYAPPRRAVTPLLADWYAKNPQVRIAHEQLARAVPRLNTPDSGQWATYLEDAILKATTGKLTAKAALDEAQAKAAR